MMETETVNMEYTDIRTIELLVDGDTVIDVCDKVLKTYQEVLNRKTRDQLQLEIKVRLDRHVGTLLRCVDDHYYFK